MSRPEEIANELRRQITTGELRPGTRVPGEPALCRRYQVAKETARRALDMLAKEGLVERRRSSGTYVLEKEVEGA